MLNATTSEGSTMPAYVEATAPNEETIYLTARELADRWRLDEATLANQRSRGEGLPFTKASGRVLYKMSDVLAVEVGGMQGWTFANLREALEVVRLTDAQRAAVLDAVITQMKN
jgi:hypothetical protein